MAVFRAPKLKTATKPMSDPDALFGVSAAHRENPIGVVVGWFNDATHQGTIATTHETCRVFVDVL